jgi:hypothetical protein
MAEGKEVNKNRVTDPSAQEPRAAMKLATCWSETSERKTPSLTFETAKRKGGPRSKG